MLFKSLKVRFNWSINAGKHIHINYWVFIDNLQKKRLSWVRLGYEYIRSSIVDKMKEQIEILQTCFKKEKDRMQ